MFLQLCNEQATQHSAVSSSDSFCLQFLSEQGDLVSLVHLSGVHSDWVQQVQYLPGSQAILSCSSSPSPSLIIRDINRRRQPYIFRVRKASTGVEPKFHGEATSYFMEEHCSIVTMISCVTPPPIGCDLFCSQPGVGCAGHRQHGP